jgi:hypothetical protein
MPWLNFKRKGAKMVHGTLFLAMAFSLKVPGITLGL